MKLKNYLSAKRLKRKLSKSNVNASQGSINDSFTDFNDNDLTSATITKDDMFLRPKRDGGIGVRSDMTQSFSGCLPSYQSQLVQTDMLTDISFRDYGSQTDLHMAAIDNAQSYSPISADPDLFFYKDSISNVEVGMMDNGGNEGRHMCPHRSISCDAYQPGYYNYHSLPSSQTSHHVIQDIHYNSLPSATTQSTHVDGDQSTAPTRQCDRWRRSRIKTNPWLPLPKTNNNETLRRPRKVNIRAEPRLSRFFSEVEELMREQLSTTTEDWAEVNAYLSQSNESLASTCSTATEIPEKMDSYPAVRSPSEGYKSACGSSDLNLADTESLSAESRGSSSSDLSKHYIDTKTSRNFTGHCPPSLQDFNVAIQTDCNWASSSSSLMSESMFSSTYTSPKSDALEDKVRKLCQSTSDLDEKMRQARLECSFIQTLS